MHFIITVVIYQTAMCGQNLIHQNKENHGTVFLFNYSLNTNLYLLSKMIAYSLTY